MTTTAKQVLEKAMGLNAGERVEVADMLYESVGPRTDADYVDAWSKEIAARLAAHESGEDKGVDWEVLRAELLSEEDGDE